MRKISIIMLCSVLLESCSGPAPNVIRGRITGITASMYSSADEKFKADVYDADNSHWVIPVTEDIAIHFNEAVASGMHVYNTILKKNSEGMYDTDREAVLLASTSKYASLNTLESFPVNNGFWQVAFSLRDTIKAERILAALTKIGWRDLKFFLNERVDSIAIYPESNRFGVSGKYTYIQNKLASIREGAVDVYTNHPDSAVKKANEMIDSFAKRNNNRIMSREIISVMNFPGEKRMWQVKFAATYDE